MDAMIAEIGRLIELHQAWAIPIIGLIAFGESLAVVGLLIPATAIMLAIGGLVGAGVLDPFPILLSTVIGAVLGDAVSYGIGRYFGPTVVHRWPLRSHRRGVARARLFFRRWGFASVFLGRFFGPVRSTIPLVAGILGMSHLRFQIANLGSAVIWAPAMLAPGYLAATGAAHTGGMEEGHWIGLIAFVTLASVALALLGIRRMNAPAVRARKVAP
ncbi:DedA family protein [Aureimonas populi]|uniref:DedA family protein n=1 Tax=Aureimonas populi TaxID=1701758 RepID=A0ABW5CI33_9HYPH|nr:DedA family protein [Aureimonas populi]